MNSKLITYLKRNPITVFIYDKYLDVACWNVKAYIFVANSGRSGSTSLTKIFQAVDKSVCFHEPSPEMINEYKDGEDRVKYFWKLFYTLKRIYIKRGARGYHYYLETNHQFIKNFIDPAIEHFAEKLKIIHLVRNPVSVAISFYQINSSPGTTSRGKYYLLDPREELNEIKIADLLYDSEEFKHDLYKCLWYWYEVEMRTKLAKQKYYQVKFCKINTDELNDKAAIVKLFNELEVPYSNEKLDALVGTKENSRTSEKSVQVDFSEVENMNKKLLIEMEKRYGKEFWVS